MTRLTSDQNCKTANHQRTSRAIWRPLATSKGPDFGSALRQARVFVL